MLEHKMRLKQYWQNSHPEMRRRMRIMLIGLAILFGAIILWKMFTHLMMKYYLATHTNPVVTVSTMKVGYASWPSVLTSVGNTRAVLGVNVTAQLAGMVEKIYFTPGSIVKENTILVQQNADPDVAQLKSLQANAELARITYERDKKQYAFRAISKQQLDSDLQNLKSLQAQVAQQSATVDKLTIRAPFDGQLGISNVNPGQFLNPGDQVVTLQRLNPIYVDFFLPQQTLSQLKMGQKATITADAFPNKVFTGKVTTIQPLVDTDTRNVEVEATVDNPNMELRPGMYVSVELETGAPKQYLTLPQSAITFNSYGNIVYIVTEQKGKKNDNGNPLIIANQKFVETGETRGDQIVILKGLNAGDVVVSSGQLKLKNGSSVEINNTVQPPNNPDPHLPNEHVGP